MAALNESNVERKLQAVSNTQDSIQSLSLWVIHHKAHHEKIVEIWFKVLKKSNTKHRVTLFNLCNDIVQTCKRKHAIVYKDAFKEMLKDAALLVRENAIRGHIERIFNIWEERGVYDGDFISELNGIISNFKSRTVMNSRLLAEFQPSKVLEKISTFKSVEQEAEAKRSQLSSLRLDASSLEAIRQLKDRDRGREFSQQFEEACVKLEDYVAQVEGETKERTMLIELLEQSELFYDAQYSEAKIVANAYKNFGTRVNNLKKKLDEMSKNLPSPVPSPHPDAPSPDQTPEYPGNEDNTEAIDMEMSDSDNEVVPVLEASTATKNYVVRKNDPAKMSESPPSPQHSPDDLSRLSPGKNKKSSSKKRKLAESEGDFSTLIPGLKIGQKSFMKDTPGKGSGSPTTSWTPNSYKNQKNKMSDTDHELAKPIAVVNQSAMTGNSLELFGGSEHGDEGDGTPVKDERGGTPVQDEEPEVEVANPIEFLTQLISQTQKATQGNSNFLQSLSVLTRTAKSPYEGGSETPEDKGEDSPEQPEHPTSWAAWKAAQNPPATQQPPPQQPGMAQPQPQQQHIAPQPYQQIPPPMMAPPPFPPALHALAPQPVPPPQMPPQPVPPPGHHSMSLPVPPPIGTWQPQTHLPLPQMVPPPGQQGAPAPPPVTGGPMMSPPGLQPNYNMPASHQPQHQSQHHPQQHHQPPPPHHQQQHQQPGMQSPPGRTAKGILRNVRANSSNLTEIPVIDDDDIKLEESPTPSTIPTIGSAGGRPLRPTFPPVASPGTRAPHPPSNPPTPTSTTSPSNAGHSVADDQQEFIEKLKRKSSLTSPTTAPPGPGLLKSNSDTNQHLRTLTEVQTDEKEGNASQNCANDPCHSISPSENKPEDDLPVSNSDATPISAINTATSRADLESRDSQDRPAQRIQSVASRVSRIESTVERRGYDQYAYDRREPYVDQYHRDREHDRYGERYSYDRHRDPYYRDTYGRPPPKRLPPIQDRRSYYPRY